MNHVANCFDTEVLKNADLDFMLNNTRNRYRNELVT